MPGESGVPGGEAEACVDEGAKAPSPASVHEENQDGGTGRKRENSPETERGDFKRLCATLETQLPSVLDKLHEGYKLTAEALQAVNENTAVRPGTLPWERTCQPEVLSEYHAGKPEESRECGMADCWSEG